MNKNKPCKENISDNKFNLATVLKADVSQAQLS